jgi:hypothetical protein
LLSFALRGLIAGAFATAVGTMFVAWLGPSIGMILTGGNPLQAILVAVVMGPMFAMFSMSALWFLLPMLAPLSALVGSTIWKLSQTRPRLRLRSVWATAGAIVAAALYAAMKNDWSSTSSRCSISSRRGIGRSPRWYSEASPRLSPSALPSGC